MMDKGSDNNFENEANFMVYGRFFIKHKLELLTLFSYEISAYNRVEHKFSNWCKLFGGMVMKFKDDNGRNPSEEEARVILSEAERKIMDIGNTLNIADMKLFVILEHH
jgi:hypothetical protein